MCEELPYLPPDEHVDALGKKYDGQKEDQASPDEHWLELGGSLVASLSLSDI